MHFKAEIDRAITYCLLFGHILWKYQTKWRIWLHKVSKPIVHSEGGRAKLWNYLFYVLTRIKMTLLRHADNADILRRLDVRWMSERQTIRYSSIYLSFEMHILAVWQNSDLSKLVWMCGTKKNISINNIIFIWIYSTNTFMKTSWNCSQL